jgi:hypothetical protein
VAPPEVGAVRRDAGLAVDEARDDDACADVKGEYEPVVVVVHESRMMERARLRGWSEELVRLRDDGTSNGVGLRHGAPARAEH